MTSPEAAQLIDEALAPPIDGFDFSWIDGRRVSTPLDWNYVEYVSAQLAER